MCADVSSVHLIDLWCSAAVEEEVGGERGYLEDMEGSGSEGSQGDEDYDSEEEDDEEYDDEEEYTDDDEYEEGEEGEEGEGSEGGSSGQKVEEATEVGVQVEA